jgi:ABC-2 type transport system permease protein
MIGRLLAIAWKELLQLRRDRLTLAMTIAFPVLQLLLFGYAISTDVRHIRTVVFDQDGTAEARDLARAMAATGNFDIVGNVASYAEVDHALRADLAHAALIIPPHFAANTAAGRPAAVQLALDGSDPIVVAAASTAASGVVAARSAQLATKRAREAGLPPPRGLVDLELDVIRLIIREGLSSSTRLRRIIARFMRGHIPLILETIGDGLAAGELDDRLPPAVILLAAVGRGALPQFARRSTRAVELFSKLPDADRLAELSIELLFKAVGAPPRRRR